MARHPTGVRALATPHHAHLGRTRLRLRRCVGYAGHAETPNDAGTTARYVKATLEEVATALAGLTGEPHPLADTDIVSSDAEQAKSMAEADDDE